MCLCLCIFRSILTFKLVHEVCKRTQMCTGHSCHVLLHFQKQQLTQQLVENAFSAQQLLHNSIPSDGSKLTTFFAGRPPELEMEVGEEEEEEGEGEEGGEEGKGEEEGEGVEEECGSVNNTGRLQPPKAKRSRSQVKALDIQTVQVSK